MGAHECRDTRCVDPTPAILADSHPDAPLPDRRRRIRWGRVFAWLMFIAAAIYFLLPLVATLLFSLRARPPGFAYTRTRSRTRSSLGR
ncbi:MAG: hypothetical protein U0869_04945 [Chloroflexota bacterium]